MGIWQTKLITIVCQLSVHVKTLLPEKTGWFFLKLSCILCADHTSVQSRWTSCSLPVCLRILKACTEGSRFNKIRFYCLLKDICQWIWLFVGTCSMKNIATIFTVFWPCLDYCKGACVPVLLLYHQCKCQHSKKRNFSLKVMDAVLNFWTSERVFGSPWAHRPGFENYCHRIEAQPLRAGRAPCGLPSA